MVELYYIYIFLLLLLIIRIFSLNWFQGYLDEWRNDCNCPLSGEQLNDLFGNIEEIYHFNR